MALANASFPRLPPNFLKTTNGLLLGNTNRLKISGFTKTPAKTRWKYPVTQCLLGVVQLTSSRASAVPYDTSIHLNSLAASIPENLQMTFLNFTSGLAIADLDPATAKLAISIMGPFFSAFGFLFILRIVMSWYPKLPVGKFPYVIAYAPTEPILSITRKVIPPLGGVDVTPVVWFGLVSFLSEILVGPQGLLVLLSQQV